MADKKILVLSDKTVIPTEEIIFRYIGQKEILWKTLMTYISEDHKDITGSWNYYNDGKSWLFKAVQKKKTIFWLTLLDETFKITFYFGDKAEPVIEASSLPRIHKDNFRNGQRYGKIRAISVKMDDLEDINSIKELIGIKKSLK
jgi:hypothetical protein